MARVLRCIFLWLTAGVVSWGQAADRVDFTFEVLPILSDRCFACHGTDASRREKDLRLDQREAALRVIAPGNPDGSDLMKRVLSPDPGEIMPPPESHLTLSNAEKETLRRWIAEGAEYREHWAFLPVQKPALPQPRDRARLRNEIDFFVQSRLEAAGLGLLPEAEPGLLLRRLSLDLTGLPPTLEELEAFSSAWKTQPARAVEQAADRLLASPHFGERMAADWLDVARFADTFGYQSDVAAHVWPYRDWVIQAFNKNLPFDQFITWQLAGDLLPEATREQRLATAFNRLHRQTNEGGSIDEEYRVEYVSDRVETYGTAFLGLTLNCAKCHDHKFDPATQRDYYSLFAFFQNIDESGLYSHFTDATPTPALSLATPAQQADATLAQAEATRAEAELALLRDQRRGAFEAWRRSEAATATSSAPAIPDEIARFSFDDITGGKTPNALDAQAPGEVFEDVAAAEGRLGGGLRLSGENNVSVAQGGQWTRDDAFSIALWLKVPEPAERAVIFHRSKAWTDAGSNGYELLLEKGRLSAALIHFWPGNALRVAARDPLPIGAWTHVLWSYDGSSRARGLRLFVNGREAAVEVVRDGLTKDINRGGENRLILGQRFRDRGFKNGLVDEWRLFTRALTPWEARAVAAEGTGVEAAPPSAGELFDYFLSAHDAPYRSQVERVKEARQRRSRAADPLPEIMAMRELPQPKPAFVLARGAYDQPGEPVTARPPEFLPPFKPGWPANRLGLARWTVARDNPLTARVIVNRLWQSFFGEGLVRTPEDFGVQGALPTHPELLDFLAARFMDSGWDFKALARLIVTSHTYRQTSLAPAAAREADPDNRLLSRGPSFRLSAEQLRDQALAAAGALDPALGGPSVDPDQASRRSLYTFWKRTMPDVRMEIFDMAKREVCTARRPLTHTPLQALTLLNEPRFYGWAREIARRAAEAEPQRDAAILSIFRQLASRQPTGREREILRRLYDETASDEMAPSPPPDPSAGAAATNEKAPPPASPHETRLLAVTQAIMNFDASVMKR